MSAVPVAGRDPQFTGTLARGLEVLRCFSAAEPVLGNKDIADRTGLSKPTVVRLTHTLALLNYLRRAPNGRKYEIGTAVLSLVYPFLAKANLRQIAWGQMQELASFSKGWVSIGVRDRTSMVYIETVHMNDTPDMKRDIGQTFPIALSAMGHAYLAALSAEDRGRLLNQLKVYRPKEWAAASADFEVSLSDYRSRGFCIRRGGAMSPHVHTVAVPMFHAPLSDIVVFNCAVPFRLLRRGQLEEEIGPRLVQLVQGVERVARAAQAMIP